MAPRPSSCAASKIFWQAAAAAQTFSMAMTRSSVGASTLTAMMTGARRGNAVFFSYSVPHPDSRTLHGGSPVLEGEKWIATKWLREREFPARKPTD